MKSLIIGASAGLGRSLAEVMARAGDEICLVSSDAEDLAAISADLNIRFGAKVLYVASDMNDVDPVVLRQEVLESFGAPDNLLYVAGVSDHDDSGPVDDALALRLGAVNFLAVVRIVNAFLSGLADEPNANIVGVGSVAAGRGRRNNSIYGAAKRGLEHYFEALRHYLADRHCRVQFYRLGYLHTSMTFGQKLPFPALDPNLAAKIIHANLGRDLGAVYLPWWWGGIVTLLRILPWPLFKRLNV